jgi:hypothetical protein
MDDVLFDMEAAAPFAARERVVAHTIWGDEPGLVTEEPKWGVAIVQLDRGHNLMVSTTRLTHEENVR